jgi:hypothetical protein
VVGGHHHHHEHSRQNAPRMGMFSQLGRSESRLGYGHNTATRSVFIRHRTDPPPSPQPPPPPLPPPPPPPPLRSRAWTAWSSRMRRGNLGSLTRVLCERGCFVCRSCAYACSACMLSTLVGILIVRSLINLQQQQRRQHRSTSRRTL